MSIVQGTYRFGPGNGELLVKTGREGIAAKLGKELTLVVGEWEGTLEVRDDPSRTRVELTADGGSLKVDDDQGGVTTLTDPDKEGIEQKIDDHVLKRSDIKFRSTRAEQREADGHIRVEGELEILGRTTEVNFELKICEDSTQAEDEEDDDEDGDAGDDGDDEPDDGDPGDDGDDEADGGDVSVTASAIVKQADFGIEQFSTLFGAVRAADEIEVTFSGKLKDPQ